VSEIGGEFAIVANSELNCAVLIVENSKMKWCPFVRIELVRVEWEDERVRRVEEKEGDSFGERGEIIAEEKNV
jgi:hypothetical protein